MPRPFFRLAAVLVVGALLSGCALTVRRPSVAELQYNPARYYDRNVAIEGVVTSSWGVPLMPVRLYRVNDGTGEMTVVSQGGRVPTRGARVQVRGRVSELATFGGRPIGLHLQERDVTIRRR
jgi:hypothetical protein